MEFTYDDGGRSDAGYKGHAADCVCRSIAIASGRPYKEIYDRLAEGRAGQRRSKRDPYKKSRSARNGINTDRKWFKDYMTELGFTWVPTMKIGQGCTVHLQKDELPSGRLVVRVSKHMTAVINGVIHDIYNPSRDGSRCVYGYYIINK